jgi:guanylate kinase
MGEEARTGAVVQPGRIFVLSGPSGVGKNTIAARLCESGRAVRVVTATSRPSRTAERNGADYYFVSAQEFEEWLREGRLLEHTRYCGHYYGTPAFSVDKAAQSGRPVLLVIDVDGALQLRQKWPEARLIFVRPPSEEALERRLRERADEDDESVERRLERARREMALAEQYDYTVVNDSLEDAVEQVARIVGSAPAPRKEPGAAAH